MDIRKKRKRGGEGKNLYVGNGAIDAIHPFTGDLKRRFPEKLTPSEYL